MRADGLIALIGVGLAVVIGWTLATIGGAPWIAALGAFAFSIFVFRANEKILPVLVVFTLALGSAYRFDVSMRSFYLRFFLLALVALRGVALFFNAKSQGEKFVTHRATLVHWCFLAVGLYGLLTAFNSEFPSASAQRAFTMVLLHFVVFVYFWLRAQTADDCEGYAAALWRSALVILGIGTIFLLLGVPGMFKGGRLRLVLGNPNQLGHYCALMAPIAVWFLLDGSKATREKWLARSVTLILLGSVFFSGSRGGLLAAAAAVLTQVFLCYRKYFVTLMVSAVVIAGFHALISSSDDSIESDPTFMEDALLRQDQLATGSGRTIVWKAARHLISKRPFFGYGFGSVDRLFEKGYFPTFEVFQGGHVHNSYIEELVNLGWFGASPLFIALGFLLFWGGSSILVPKERTHRYRLATALFGVIVAGAISGVVESWFTSVGSVFCFPFWFSAMLFLKVSLYLNDWSRNPRARA